MRKSTATNGPRSNGVAAAAQLRQMNPLAVSNFKDVERHDIMRRGLFSCSLPYNLCNMFLSIQEPRVGNEESGVG